MQLTTKSGMLDEITSLAVALCSPIIDCVRFVSGTLAAYSIASYCLQNKIRMDWSPCTVVQEYWGAEVLNPIIGLHENVVSCDFSSMYPTVLIGANISLENCIVAKATADNGATWTEDGKTTFVVNGSNLTFDNRDDCVVPPVMKLFIDKRKQVKKSKPAYAWGLKIAANSIYGSLGNRHSRIYSPNCSAFVTTGRRWCLATAEVILKSFGFKVVYGDTDSCFVASTDHTKTDIHIATKILSRIFNFTPFPGMSMEVENRYSKIAFLGKKTYFGKVQDSPIVSKGMSKSRKDRIGISQILSDIIVPTILTDILLRQRQEAIADMRSVVVDAMVSGRLSLQQISKIVKRGGSNYYEYRLQSGTREFLECESSTGMELVPYSTQYISKSLKTEIASILAITGMGSLGSIIRYASVI